MKFISTGIFFQNKIEEELRMAHMMNLLTEEHIKWQIEEKKRNLKAFKESKYYLVGLLEKFRIKIENYEPKNRALVMAYCYFEEALEMLTDEYNKLCGTKIHLPRKKWIEAKISTIYIQMLWINIVRDDYLFVIGQLRNSIVHAAWKLTKDKLTEIEKRDCDKTWIDMRRIYASGKISLKGRDDNPIFDYLIWTINNLSYQLFEKTLEINTEDMKKMVPVYSWLSSNELLIVNELYKNRFSTIHIEFLSKKFWPKILSWILRRLSAEWIVFPTNPKFYHSSWLCTELELSRHWKIFVTHQSRTAKSSPIPEKQSLWAVND